MIQIKLEEKSKADKAKTRKELRAQILDAINDKRSAELRSASLDDLEAKLAELENEG